MIPTHVEAMEQERVAPLLGPASQPQGLLRGKVQEWLRPSQEVVTAPVL